MTTRFKAEDTPTLTTTLENIDLSGNARVRIVVDHPDDDVLVVNKTTDDPDGPTLEDELQGLVEYQFTQSETARSGRHRVEWVVEYTDGSQLSHPPNGYIQLRSEEPLDRDATVEEVETNGNQSLTDLYVDSIYPNSGTSVSVRGDLDHNGNDLQNVGSASIDETRTETLGFDLNGTNPQSPMMPQESPGHKLKPRLDGNNPVATIDDVDDMPVDTATNPHGVADPFVVYDEEDGKYYLLCEVLVDNATDPMDHRVGVWTSDDGANFSYLGEALNPANWPDVTRFHYPYTFKADGDWYMTPSGSDIGTQLFRATDFPTEWESVMVLQSDGAGDPTIIYWNDTWWMFDHWRGVDPVRKRVWYSDDLLSTFEPHPSNPIVEDNILGRNAGRPIITDNHIDMWCRGSVNNRGRVSAIRITELTKTNVEWSEWGTNPVTADPQFITPTATTGADTKRIDGQHHHVSPIPGNVQGQPPLFMVDGHGDEGMYEVFSFEYGAVKPGARVHQSAAQSIPSTSFTRIEWDEKRWDNYNAVDIENNIYTIPEFGNYEINVNVTLDTNLSTFDPFRVNTRIYADGTGVAYGNDHVSLNQPAAATVSSTQNLAEGTDISVETWHNAGESQSTDAGRVRTWMDIKMIGQS